MALFKGGPVPPSSSSSRTFPDSVKAGVRALFGEGLERRSRLLLLLLRGGAPQ
jgi:hypothetical protein